VKERAMGFPARDEWAKQRRAACNYEKPPISDRIGEYATPSEIEGLTVALRERWKELGLEMRRLLGGKDARAAS
jgi:hypothetical protein